MDNNNHHHHHHNQRKSISKTTKKKPIKVVYISNPMKVKTSASEFRSLVQQLTGQDASSVPDPAMFSSFDHHDADQIAGIDSAVVVSDEFSEVDLHPPSHHNQQQQLQQEQNNGKANGDFDHLHVEYQPFDFSYDYGVGVGVGYNNMLPHQNLLMENFPGFFPSSLCCQSSNSSQVDDLRSL